jgi:hypothetical protein
MRKTKKKTKCCRLDANVEIIKLLLGIVDIYQKLEGNLLHDIIKTSPVTLPILIKLVQIKLGVEGDWVDGRKITIVEEVDVCTRAVGLVSDQFRYRKRSCIFLHAP